MEHIWLDRDGQAEPENVPLFNKIIYDGAGFSDYLLRLGLDAQKLLDLLKETYKQEEGPVKQAVTDYLNSVVQEWLFVAIVIEVFGAIGLNVPRESLVKIQGEKQFLTSLPLRYIATAAFAQALSQNDLTRFLPTYVDSPMASRIEFEREVYKRAWQDRKASRGLWASQKLDSVATIVENVLTSASSFLQVSYPRENCLDIKTWLACRILSESLQSLFFWFLGLDWETRARADPVGFWGAIAKDRQLCPFRTNKLYSAVTVTDAYIAASLTPIKTQDHKSCSADAYCRAKTILDDCPAHRADCDRSCTMLNLTAQDILILDDALSTGHWGILRFKNDNPDSAEFYMESSLASPTSFVAISHVWTHGLGNPLANALWSCQILFLKQVMSRAGCAHMGLWLDPLCVPLNSKLKMQAISQMDQIYTVAAMTIVLDHSLEKQKGSNAHKMIHILISDWLTRIWTLQEALLPKEKLHFLFDDGVHSIATLTAHPNHFKEFTMSSALLQITWRDELLTNLRRGSDQPFMSLVESFHLRSTTRQEDEAICLAILCEIPITSLPSKPELHHVIAKMDTVPQDIVYAIGSRSTAPGFGWLPATFISKSTYKKYQSEQSMVPRDGRGLCMYKRIARIAGAFTFDPTFGTLRKRHYQLFARSTDEHSYRISLIDPSTMSISEQAQTRRIDKAALIFEKSLDSDVCVAILVSNLRLGEDGDMHAKYEARLFTIERKHFEYGIDDVDDYPYTHLTAPLEAETRIWVN